MSQQLEYNDPRAFQTKWWKRGKVVAQILYVDEVCNDEVYQFGSGFPDTLSADPLLLRSKQGAISSHSLRLMNIDLQETPAIVAALSSLSWVHYLAVPLW